MRWYILRTLLYKEVMRHAANRGAIALAALLVAAALLLSLFGKPDDPVGLMGGIQTCYVDYWEDGPWIEYLRQHTPPELQPRIVYRGLKELPLQNGHIVYQPRTAAIQVRLVPRPGNVHAKEVRIWHAVGEAGDVLPYEAWFWKESHHYLASRAVYPASQSDMTAEALVAADGTVKDSQSSLAGAADMRSSIATSLVLFGLFFVCVYLLPSLACEERETGVLLAQALSPACPAEILMARFLFYPVVGMALSAILAGIYSPAALAKPFFWLALLVTAIGSMGIGLTIACVARNQRTASMASLCYMLVVAMVLVICQQGSVPVIPWLLMEYHCPRMIQAVMTEHPVLHWGNLFAAGGIALCWAALAARIFRRYGWQ